MKKLWKWVLWVLGLVGFYIVGHFFLAWWFGLLSAFIYAGTSVTIAIVKTLGGVLNAAVANEYRNTPYQ